MLSSRLAIVFFFLGLFWFNNADNEVLTCTTNNALVSRIYFNPGVRDFNQNIQVTGETPFSDCINGTTRGTGKLIINNNQSISFSCFDIFTHSLTAYVSFSFDSNQIHYVTLEPQINFLSFLLPVTYVGTINPKLYGADTLTVAINYEVDILQADPALTCISPGLASFNGTAILTLQ